MPVEPQTSRYVHTDARGPCVYLRLVVHSRAGSAAMARVLRISFAFRHWRNIMAARRLVAGVALALGTICLGGCLPDRLIWLPDSSGFLFTAGAATYQGRPL